MNDTVRYERDGHVATITYNRPEVLNAINGELRQGLNAAWNQFREDEDAWVGIVTGAGQGVLRRRGPEGRARLGRASGRARSGRSRRSTRSRAASSSGSRRSPRSTATASATGSPRWRAATSSSRATGAEFGFPEVRLGVPTIVGAMRLPGRVGWSNAMEMLLTGERFGAEQAHEMGLVWRVVPHDGPHGAGADPRRPARPGCTAGPAGDEGDGGSRRAPAVGGRPPARRVHAPRRGRERGRVGGDAGRAPSGATRSGVVGSRAAPAASRSSPGPPRRQKRSGVGSPTARRGTSGRTSPAPSSSGKACPRPTASARSATSAPVRAGAARRSSSSSRPITSPTCCCLALPLRSYRADIELTPDGTGTLIAWRATFEPKLAGHRRLLRPLPPLHADRLRPRPRPPHHAHSPPFSAR